MVSVEVGVPIHAPVILDPGALISTQVPKFEKPDFPSLDIVAPTVIALGALAGERRHASVDSLPAAATTMIPAFVRRVMLLFTAADFPPPILRLRTAALFGFGFSGLKIQSRPAITPEVAPVPEQLKILTETKLALFAIPY